MTFMESIQTVLQKYADFTGRARRSEYWWFVLAYSVVNFVISLIGSIAGGGVQTATSVISGIIGLGLIVPSLSVGARRLHDIGKSGWWQLLSLIPCVGGIILIIWCAKDSDPGDNMYGPNPKGM